MFDTRIDPCTPGLAEALNAVARLADDELVSCVAGATATIRAALAAGEAVAAQTASFYLTLVVIEVERRCLSTEVS